MSIRRRGSFASVAAAVILSLPAPVPSPPGRLEPASRSDGAVRGVPGPFVFPREVEVASLPESPEGAVAAPRFPKLERGPRLRVPHGLPIPPGARILLEPAALPSRERRAAPREIFAEEAIPSPPLDASFAALPDDGASFPPDTNGGASASQLVTMLNSQFRIQDRAGNAAKTTSIEDFWGVASGRYLTDPRILYLPKTARWVAVILSGTSSRTATLTTDLLLAVSKTGDAAGVWDIYDVPVNGAGETFSGDFPAIGYSRDRIAVQMNLFDQSLSNFIASRIFVFDRAALESGRLARPTVLTAKEFGSTQFPAADLDGDSPDVYLLEDWDGNASEGGLLRLFSIAGPLGSESLAPIAFLGTQERWNDFTEADNFGPQMGSTTGIATNSADFSSPIVYRKGFLWAAHTVFLPPGAPTRSAVQWWQIATDGSVAQRGRLDDPSAKDFFAFPSIAVNRDDHVLVGCSRFSADRFAGAVYAYRAAADPDGILRAEAPVKDGEAAYVRRSTSKGPNRWGDYSATAVDPDDAGFWTLQEYAATSTPSSGSSWGTWWGHVIAEPPVAPTASFDLLPATPVAGLPVLFHDTSAGGPIAWSWDFGDGTGSSQKNPAKTFSAVGAYAVALTVSNRAGVQTTSALVAISPPPVRAGLAPAPRHGAPRIVVRPD